MSDSQIVWIIGSISMAGAALLGIVYRLTSNNEKRLDNHGVLLVRLESVPDKLEEIHSKVSTLMMDVAVLKNRSQNGRRTDTH